MKKILLSLIISFSLFAQTNDSLGVIWTDPVDADLNYINLYYWTGSGDTNYFAYRDEGVEQWDSLAPASGLLRIFAKAVDDSGNVSAFSNMDTVTVGQSGGATERVAGDSILFDYHDLTDGTVTTGEWVDQIHGRAFTVTGTPSKGATGITLDGSDGFYNDLPDYTIPTALTFEVVITLDVNAFTGVHFIAGVTDGSTNLQMFINADDRFVISVGGDPAEGTYDATSLDDTETHITWSHNATLDSVWFNGVAQTPISYGSGNGGDQDYLTFGQYDAGGTGLVNGSLVKFYAVNPKYFTDAEAEQNYTWWTEQ